MKGGGLCLLVV